MASEQLREFIFQYKAELEDLTSNVKVAINTLSQLADEWKEQAAPSIAALVEKRLLNCDPKHKLPALYLLDSIVKNVRQPYISLFARNLPEVFSKIWQSCEDARQQLTKLLGTWTSLFPAEMLSVIQQRIQSVPQRPVSAPRPVGATPAMPVVPPAPPSAAYMLPHDHSSLLQAGLLSIPASDAGMTSAYGQGLPQGPSSSPGSLSPRSLKAHDPDVIMSLLDLPEHIKAKHRGVYHKQQQKKRKAMEQPMSRHWYADSNSWIKATTIDPVSLAQEQQEEDAEQLPQKVPTVPVDDSQQECALSGEKFDTIWDIESEDWHYLGAVRLDAQQAARYGLAEGVLVLADCLSTARQEDAGYESPAAEEELPAQQEGQVVKAEDPMVPPPFAASLSPSTQLTGIKRTHLNVPAIPPADETQAEPESKQDLEHPDSTSPESAKQEPVASAVPQDEEQAIHEVFARDSKRVKVEPV
ncbi:hypothetical protein WJX84_000921 [Apatococcus fuscideae]|uniref:CID domain-containing protein n=1 Tax=Apatococcus fuscideae TaxID=2026836 RepID=A0AAW1THJ9_9CHLO